MSPRMGTGTGTDACRSKRWAIFVKKNKSTADSTSVCDIDIIFSVRVGTGTGAH
jgi:hypothetical protein